MIAFLVYLLGGAALHSLRLWYLQRWLETQGDDISSRLDELTIEESLRRVLSRRDTLWRLLILGLNEGSLEITERNGVRLCDALLEGRVVPRSRLIADLLNGMGEHSWAELRDRCEPEFNRIDHKLQELGLFGSREEWLWLRAVSRLLPGLLFFLGLFKSRSEWLLRSGQVHAGLEPKGFALHAPELYALAALGFLLAGLFWPIEPKTFLTLKGQAALSEWAGVDEVIADEWSQRLTGARREWERTGQWDD